MYELIGCNSPTHLVKDKISVYKLSIFGIRFFLSP